MTTWQENLKEAKKSLRELHQVGKSLAIGTTKETEDNGISVIFTWKNLDLVKELINQFDRASEDKAKLEIAGRLISLIQKVML